ncbi:MAG: hypothetical protein AB2L07_06540 [Thermoanaerobaculaceae bacterium]
MTKPDPRFGEIFFELYEGLPRQSPGNWICSEKAFGHCHELPDRPSVLDLGCGVGGQTLHLAERGVFQPETDRVHMPPGLPLVLAPRGVRDDPLVVDPGGGRQRRRLSATGARRR